MRLSLGDYYEVEPEVPTGELPRRADMVLIRRERADPPFAGIWMHLAEWNLFEFKSPTDAPEEADLGLLMHVGTGVHYRYNEERKACGEGPIRPGQFALWYVVPSLGETFFGRAQQRAFFRAEGGGLWRGKAWGHPVFLLNYGQADPGQLDALPLNILRRDLGTPSAMRDLLASRLDLLRQFARLLVEFQPRLWEALKAMAQTKDIIDWVEVGRVTTDDIDKFVANWPTDKVVQAVGEGKMIQTIGEGKVIQTIGEDKVIQTIGEERLLQKLLKHLTSEQLAELVRKQQEQG
ncbi:MAG: hypothetical protein ACRC33_13575 [Gemmataceae bacterium]